MLCRESGLTSSGLLMTKEQAEPVQEEKQMNAAKPACASSGEPDAWEQIDWPQCEKFVSRLQARIVKSIQTGRWGKVKALQRLLVHSFSGRALAVKRVTENQGKRTPGVDGSIWSTPASKRKAINMLHRRGYQPQPLRRVYIPKANGKWRPLGIPTMTDRAMQALYLLALLPIAETKADPNSYGFRPKRSTADAIEQCHTTLASPHRAEWVLEGDIKGCFDHISHDWMQANIPMDADILKKWLKAGYVENRNLFPTESGTPQGGIISPTLANLTLDGLERLLKDRFRIRIVRKQRFCPKVNLVRYADDFIVTGVDKTMLENEVRPVVEQFLRERGLQLSPEKTCVTHVGDGFDFLGQNLRKFRGHLIIQPSKKNTQQCLDKVRTLIRQHRSLSQIQLIAALNPVLRGWSNYHQYVVAKRTFQRVDYAVRNSLWFWAKRRHRNKSSSWIASRYWHRLDGREVFAADTGTRTTDGKTIRLRLHSPSRLPIRRYIKIKGEANPFDPAWRQYFEDRKIVKRFGTTRVRGKK